VFRQRLERPARYCSASCRQMAYLKRRLRPRLGIRSQPSGNDNVQTPLRLALSAALQPSGTILEPCSGDGHFVRALRPFGVVAWCEITRGRDFFAWTEHVDWCVGNPPWSRYRAFLAHALSRSRTMSPS